MAFKDIPNIMDYNFYLQNAFTKAKKVADSMRSSLKLDKLKKSKTIEIEKIKTISHSISENMINIGMSFPTINTLTPFYKELVSITLDLKAMKKSLADINFASKKVVEFSKVYVESIKKVKTVRDVNKHRKEFCGRVAHMLKKMRKSFEYLEFCRKTLVEFPVIKQMFTVAIAGFPNVGKSTLLKKLTGANVEIKNYAFTTKQLLIGYLKEDYDKIQFIDTPGTLNRPDKMNNIEKQAYLAMKTVADVIIYVFDPTEAYPIERQEKLFHQIKKYGKPVIPYLSKVDIATSTDISRFEKFKCLKSPEEVVLLVRQMKKNSSLITS